MKQKLKKGEHVLGTWCVLPSTSVISVLGAAGLDFVIIDMEHGPMDFALAEDMAKAAESEGCVPIIRVPKNDESMVLRALDIGAYGVVVPHITSLEDRRKAISYIKYPPIGVRGFSPYTRAGGYRNTKDYTSFTNKQTLSVLIVEGVEGLKNLDEIVDDEHIDVLYIGTYDLSQAIGRPGQVNHPEVKKHLEDCVKKIRNSGKAVGCLIHNKNELQWFIDIGIQFITYVVDDAVLYNSFHDMKQEFERIESGGERE